MNIGLFDAADVQGEKVLTVSQFNRTVKAIIENEPLLRGVCVAGEISGFRRYPSGHLYFTVKDEGSALSCVMFQSSAARLRFLPSDGMKVRVWGNATIYEKDGRYQFMVSRMTPEGVGGLYAAFEQLKKKLAAEGLFDESKKKPLPPFPRRIGVITSSAGAALHDILSVTGRRFPCAQILVVPSAVQGEEAPGQLRRAVEYFSAEKNIDVLIIGRGGGSIEDLWAFNDEALARSLAACPIPTVSAVGHETDFTICDFVCDKRAPTPSAAAELVTPDRNDLLFDLSYLSQRVDTALDAFLGARREKLKNYAANAVLRDAGAGVRIKKLLLDGLEKRFTAGAVRGVERKRASCSQISGKLLSLNPMSVLSRGYGAVFDEQGRVVRSAKTLKNGEKFRVRMCDGEVPAVVRREDQDG